MPKMTDQPTTRELVRHLLSTGHTPREIAKRLDITTQAVYLHMEALKEAAKAGEASA